MPNLLVDPPQYFAGETVRFWARDVLNQAGEAVTEGAIVSVELVNEDGLTVTSGDGEPDTVDPNDWYADVNLPDVAGMYTVATTVVVGEIVWISKERFYIYP